MEQNQPSWRGVYLPRTTARGLRSSQAHRTKRYAQGLREKFAHLLNVLGLSVHRTSNILSYSFLVPLLSILISVVTEHGINSDQFEMFVESLATSAMIAIPGVAIRDVLSKAAEIIQQKGLK